jgi:tau tubulin kinase
LNISTPSVIYTGIIYLMNLLNSLVISRDIKPGNFAIGRRETNENHIVFMLDFGLCRKIAYLPNLMFISSLFSSEVHDIRLPREIAPFRGTTRYASLAAQKEVEQSRKDDVEAWLYVVVEWTGGGLPWKKMQVDEHWVGGVQLNVRGTRRDRSSR